MFFVYQNDVRRSEKTDLRSSRATGASNSKSNTKSSCARPYKSRSSSLSSTSIYSLASFPEILSRYRDLSAALSNHQTSTYTTNGYLIYHLVKMSTRNTFALASRAARLTAIRPQVSRAAFIAAPRRAFAASTEQQASGHQTGGKGSGNGTAIWAAIAGLAGVGGYYYYRFSQGDLGRFHLNSEVLSLCGLLIRPDSGRYPSCTNEIKT